MKFKRKISLLLIFAVVCGIIFSIPAFAGSGTPGQILHMSGTARVESAAKMYSAPGTGGTHSTRDSVYLTTVKAGTMVTFDYLENDGDGDTWYHITSGAGQQGFIITTKIKIITSTTPSVTPYDASFEQLL
ncbi:MAG TPA: hypothetical protein DEW35_05475, partial [Ruminococcaceae bacterium]|nr:hypothetical protein [Oscillospiraceae bacterium]